MVNLETRAARMERKRGGGWMDGCEERGDSRYLQRARHTYSFFSQTPPALPKPPPPATRFQSKLQTVQHGIMIGTGWASAWASLSKGWRRPARKGAGLFWGWPRAVLLLLLNPRIDSTHDEIPSIQSQRNGRNDPPTNIAAAALLERATRASASASASANVGIQIRCATGDWKIRSILTRYTLLT